MVRTPCCKSEGLKRGTWTPEEDEKLIAYIQEHGEGGWRTLPEKAGLKRCGKSCRLRWANYLRPDIKRGEFSPEDEEIIIKLHAIKGNKWSAIARRLPGRTDNEVKNYWNTHMKKRLIQNGIDPTTHKPINPGSYKEDTGSTNSPCSASVPVSDSAPGSASGSAQLLNRVATKFSLNANRIFLAEIIQAAGKKNPDGNLTTELPETGSNMLKPVRDGTGEPKKSTSKSTLSDEAPEISMHDSNSTGSGNYCTDTPSDEFQVIPIETIGSENLEASWESLKDFQDEDFFDSNNEKAIRVMQDLENVFSDGRNCTVGQDSEELVSIGSYWNDDMGFDDFGLLDSSPFLPII